MCARAETEAQSDCCNNRGKAAGVLNQIITINLVRCGQIDSGYVSKVESTGFAEELNVQREKWESRVTANVLG